MAEEPSDPCLDGVDWRSVSANAVSSARRLLDRLKVSSRLDAQDIAQEAILLVVSGKRSWDEKQVSVEIVIYKTVKQLIYNKVRAYSLNIPHKRNYEDNIIYLGAASAPPSDEFIERKDEIKAAFSKVNKENPYLAKFYADVIDAMRAGNHCAESISKRMSMETRQFRRNRQRIISLLDRERLTEVGEEGSES